MSEYETKYNGPCYPSPDDPPISLEPVPIPID